MRKAIFETTDLFQRTKGFLHYFKISNKNWLGKVRLNFSSIVFLFFLPKKGTLDTWEL